ncbi:MAG: hypothetical protein K6B28_07570 [Lachnospiraceae bacterium]|nr:hypothetical protein [Lachnospiraceae bacterium]
MRAKKEVFEEYFKNMNKGGNDFSKIRELLSDNGKRFFLGVREDYLSIYYMGMSIATVKALKTGGCSYSLSYYYLKGVKDENGNSKYDNKMKGYYSIPSEVFWQREIFDRILKNVEEHVLGFGREGHTYLEKACQQWIINTNNNDPGSKWYYADMEYIYKEDGEKSDHPFGRADLIAISKEPDCNGIFQLAFVELKVGTGAYGISIKVPKKIVKKEEQEKYRENVKKWLKEDFWGKDVLNVKLGSGLSSHVVDFLHFFADNNATKQLRKEIAGIIDIHKKFGLIGKDVPLYKLKSEHEISNTTDIYIVTYSEAPGIKKEMLSMKAQEKYTVPTMHEMKEQFGKYFYKVEGSSSMPVECLIDPNVIDGLISLKDEYIEFTDNNEEQIECIQNIKNTDHRFVFRFIDVNDKETNPVHCII